MKKNKNKGFTLIELLAVIAVLTLVVVFTIPVVLNTLNNSKEKAIVAYKNNLLSSAKIYVEEFDDEISYQIMGDKKIACISANILKEKGYMKNKEIVNYSNDGIDYNNALIKIVKDENNRLVEATFHEKKLTCYDENGIFIDTNDLVKKYEVLETKYNTSAVTAYFGGKDITNLIETSSSDNTLIIPNNNGVFNKIGNFILTYRVNYTFGGLSEIAESEFPIIVEDTKKPSLKLLGDDSLMITLVVGSSYVEPGYEITDNYYAKVSNTVSGKVGDYTVNINSNLDTSRVGVYFIKYIVTDGSGNISNELTRTIHVVPTPITQYSYSDYVEESYTASCPESYTYSCTESYTYPCTESYTYSCTESYTGTCSGTCHSSMSLGSCINSGGSCGVMSGSHCGSCSYSCNKSCTKTRTTTCSGTRDTTCSGTRNTTCSGTRYYDCTKTRNVWTAYGNWEDNTYTVSSTRKVKKRVCNRDLNYNIVESTCVVTDL